MGSAISGLYADMVMTDLETRCLHLLKFIHNITPLFYYRYIDDTILCVDKNHVNTILEIFNSYHGKLKFTHEIETDNAIPFLDILIIKQNNSIVTDWYSKTSSSGRFLNFNSKHPMQQKIAMISNLVDRSILLADPQFHKKNINKIKKLLILNNYPTPFINKHIYNRLKKHKYTDNCKISKNKLYKKFYALTPKISLPIIGNTFEKFTTTFKKFNVLTTPKIEKNLNNIIKLGKDKTEKMQKTNVVYKINCKGCTAS